MPRAIVICLTLAVLGALVIVTLPIGIERYAVGWLGTQGVSNRAVDDVDFNPFTGILRFELSKFSGEPNQRGEVGLAELNFEWTGLFSRQVMLSSFTLRDAQIDIQRLDDGRYSIGGLLVPLAPAAAPQEDEPPGEVSWGFGITDVVIENVALTYRDERVFSRIKVDRLSLDQLATWEGDSVTQLLAELELDGSAISLNAEILPFANEPGLVGSSLRVDKLALQPYGALLAAAGIENPEGLLSLELRSKLRYQMDSTLFIELAGTAALANLAATLPMGKLSNNSLNWSGDLTANVPNSPDGALDVSGTTGLNISGFSLDALDRPIRLLAFEELAIEDVVVRDLEFIEIGGLTARSFDVLRREADDQSTLSIGSILLETIGIADRTSLNIERARLDAVVASVVRREDGQLALVSEVIDDLAAQTADDAASAGDASESVPVALPASDQVSQAPFTFYIALLEIGKNSRVAFQDLAVSPPFSTQVELDRVQLSEFGNTDPKQPAKIALELNQGDSATLSVAGDLWLFGSIGSDLKIALKGFDLTEVSSYFPVYHIQRGRLTVDAQARLNDDVLDVSSELTLEKLTLAGKAGGEQSALGSGMAMPLDVALDLLRDSNDTIALKLPITGSINDPQLGTGDIIRQATQSALQKSAISYVKNALQPLGAIMFVASVAGKAARPRFDPVLFVAGGSELTPEASAYLEKIAKMLRDRPELSITFCGISTLPDRDVLAQAVNGDMPDIGPSDAIPTAESPPPELESEMLELARVRGNVVQEFFVAGHGIDAKRLFRCRPILDVENVELPRVEIML